MNPVIAMLIGVVVMMVLVICTRMHAFPSLIISAILIAVLSGNYLLVGTGNEGGNLLSVAISTVTGGFGGTMTSIGIVIGFGCIMGIFLEKSGAAKRMAITILKLVGVKRADVVLGLTGFVVSIPVFCDSGFVILSSLAKEFSRLTKKSMVGLGGILGMGLYITHFMVPPTPGPLAVVSTFQNEGINIDLGMFIIAGLLFSIPLFIFSVFLFRWFGNKYPQFIVPYEIDRSKYTEAQLKVLDKIDAKIKAGKELENEDFTELLSTEKLPSAGLSFTILLLPVFLILANTLVSQTAFKATIVGEIITFLGNPVIALFISLCLGAFLLAKDLDNKTVVGMMNDALRDAGPIVMITAGGGALGAVVKATGAAGMMAALSARREGAAVVLVEPNEKLGRKQYLVPYLMSSHPGATLDDAIMLAQYLNRVGYMPEQVQDFYPTPGTMSTCMFYTGLDPRTMQRVYVPRSPSEKAMQRALMQYRRPQNYFLVREALQKAGRTDLIGFDPKCLIRPYPPKEKKPGAPDAQPARRTAPAKPAKKRPPRR